MEILEILKIDRTKIRSENQTIKDNEVNLNFKSMKVNKFCRLNTKEKEKKKYEISQIYNS